MQRQKQKNDEDAKPSTTSSLIATFRGETHFCTADQCYRVPPSTPQITIPIPIHSSDTFVETEQSEDLISFNSSHPLNENNLLVSSEFIELIKTAAVKGCLTGFLLTLCTELGTDIFKACHMTPQQINWANQAVRTLLVWKLGTELPLALAIPIITFLLTEYPLKWNKNKVNLATLGMLVSAAFLNNPATFLIAISMVMMSSLVTKNAYGWAKNGLYGEVKKRTSETENKITLGV